MKTITLIYLGVLLSHATAQLPAALKPHTDKFEADRAALAASAAKYLTDERVRYLTALDVAQKAATAAGRHDESAGITAERLDINAGTPASIFPPDLPKTLTGRRHDYLAALAFTAKTVPIRLRDIASKYLQAIASFESSALQPADAATTAGIAAEKQRVMDILDATGGVQKHQNIIANSDFSQGELGLMPPKWQAEAEIPVTDATLVADGEARFLRFRRLQPLRRANLVPEKEVIIPAKARSVAFSARLRVKGLVPGKDYHQYPGIHITGRDAHGEERGGDWAIVKRDANWKRLTVRFALPSEAKTLRIAVGPFGAACLLDVDDVEVEFK